MSRSSLYYEPRPADAETLALQLVVDKLYMEFPYYGTRRVMLHLRREGHAVGRDRARRGGGRQRAAAGDARSAQSGYALLPRARVPGADTLSGNQAPGNQLRTAFDHSTRLTKDRPLNQHATVDEGTKNEPGTHLVWPSNCPNDPDHLNCPSNDSPSSGQATERTTANKRAARLQSLVRHEVDTGQQRSMGRQMVQSMMRRKLHEARYFRRWMERNASDRLSFTYELSAFLTAARTVLQYLHRECCHLGEPNWYESQMANGTLRFFKDQRDVNIHAKPVEPDQTVAIEIKETITVGDSFSITTTDEKGNVVQHHEVSSPPVAPPATNVEVKYEYYFSECSDQLEVLALCDKYLQALDTILSDWESRESSGVAPTKS